MDYAVEKGYLVQNPLPRYRPMEKRERGTTPRSRTCLVSARFCAISMAFAYSLPEAPRRGQLLLSYSQVERISEVVNAKWEEFDLEAGTSGDSPRASG